MSLNYTPTTLVELKLGHRSLSLTRNEYVQTVLIIANHPPWEIPENHMSVLLRNAPLSLPSGRRSLRFTVPLCPGLTSSREFAESQIDSA